MFYLIKDGKITDSSEYEISQDGSTTIEYEFSTDDFTKIKEGCLINISRELETLVITMSETVESEKYELTKKIKRAREIKLALANDLLSDVSTLPELGEVEDERLAKITELETEYNALISDISTYTVEERTIASAGLFDDIISSIF